MHSLEKHNYISRNIHKNTPSFSSTLLEEIYRSVDAKSEDFPPKRGKPAKNQGICLAKTNIIEDEFRASLTRARLVEKWIQNAKNQKNPPKRSENNSDLLFFTSTSSSNSDSSGALSSSDTEFFASQTGPKVSCFSTRPKPIRTTCLPAHESKWADHDKSQAAHKMYSDLKKAKKQPISPGGRLTSLISSIFANASGKMPKNAGPRSCLSKYSFGSREKTKSGAHEATVSVLEESKSSKMEKCGKIEVGVENERKGYNGNKKMDDFSVIGEIRDCDGISDSSSDLFELDHLDLFGDSSTFCKELPVYETTCLDANRVITDRLIR
ncbi:hypothetical protein STAS_29044 [Striga asiatica]|uniref:Uncharacterized protein n=1 Tax=Striga asiatica TaxID=4170 RepID=A0A5A7R1S5_STRAF|nr:hypothetical protein STAS_29044 [Striga asiatica]